jgi:phosphoribosylformimino-5-aminoimidazole carboxamide ribonucleotide (ProFAR) isomerase
VRSPEAAFLQIQSQPDAAIEIKLHSRIVISIPVEAISTLPQILEAISKRIAVGLDAKNYLHAESFDMRKSFDWLFAIIKEYSSLDARDGDLFMFINLRRNRIAIG